MKYCSLKTSLCPLVCVVKMLTRGKVAIKGYCCCIFSVKITIFSTIALPLLIVCSQKFLLSQAPTISLLFSVLSGSEVPLDVPFQWL